MIGSPEGVGPHDEPQNNLRDILEKNFGLEIAYKIASAMDALSEAVGLVDKSAHDEVSKDREAWRLKILRRKLEELLIEHFGLPNNETKN